VKLPFSRLSLLWKIPLSSSIAITLLFAATGWIVMDNAVRATSESVEHEVQASFQAYQSLWRARAERLASITLVLSTMSDVRAAFGTGDEATIRDTAAELWSRVSDEEAIFLVTDPEGRVIASLGGGTRRSLPQTLPVVREARARFPAQVSGFLARNDSLFHVTITPVYVQATGGEALLDVLVAGYQIDPGVAERLKDLTGGSEFLFFSQDRMVASTLGERAATELAPRLAGTVSTPVHAGKSGYAPLITPLPGIDGKPVGRLAILRSFDAAERQIAGLRRNILLLWLGAMALGVGLTYWLARRIIGPVRELDRAAAEVARNNYDYQVRVESGDELGRLAATFNAMCASIRQAQDDLVNQERIATVGRLAASIVHDLRNPLAAVYGGAEMLMDGHLAPAQVSRLARNMYRSSRQIQAMLDDMLEVSRGRTGPVETCDLCEIASAAAQSLAETAEAQGVSIAVEAPEPIELPLERRRIERVFLNLLANALEAMPDGGAVAISAKAAGDSALVEVCDTGPGVPPGIRGRLFQPFVTAGKHGGLGLGLALSRRAVVDHGGDLWVKPGAGPGACFCFRLPLRSTVPS
jgi:signal transduction histidine kinase